MFDAKKCPAYNKGRWYEFFIESDGANYKLTTKDMEGAYITGTNLAMEQNFHVVDFLTDINPIETTGSNYNDTLHFFADSRQGVVLPGAGKFDWMRVYVFGYFS